MVYSSVYLIMYLYYFITVLTRRTRFAEYIIIFFAQMNECRAYMRCRRCLFYLLVERAPRPPARKTEAATSRRFGPSVPIAGGKLLCLFTASRTYQQHWLLKLRCGC